MTYLTHTCIQLNTEKYLCFINTNFTTDPSGSVTTSPIRAASEIQAFRNVVLKDIIDSEKAHVAEMQGLVSNFLQPLEKSDM